MYKNLSFWQNDNVLLFCCCSYRTGKENNVFTSSYVNLFLIQLLILFQIMFKSHILNIYLYHIVGMKHTFYGLFCYTVYCISNNQYVNVEYVSCLYVDKNSASSYRIRCSYFNFVYRTKIIFI